MLKNRYILAIDPSGAFTEGKGTTGWCLRDAVKKTFLHCGVIKAVDFKLKEEYWDAHIALIAQFKRMYHKELKVMIEDYFIYANKIEAHINSRLETSKLIGIMQHTCWSEQISYTMQRASDVQSRWTDEILIHKNILEYRYKKYYTPGGTYALCEHTRDAIRHAIHYETFYNK